MCTLTWRQDAHGYELFFNRDELHGRQEASAPQICQSADGVPYLAPRDADGGGTWMLTNAFGFTTALLNHYEADAELSRNRGKWTSRGLLVLSLAGCRDVDGVDSCLKKGGFSPYRPFVLTAFDAHGQARRWQWDGRACRTAPLGLAERPVTTSSCRGREVCAQRRAAFRTLANPNDAEALMAYHLRVEPTDSACSVRMRRDDAQTVSFSRVTVTDTAVRYLYRPEERGSYRLLPDVVNSLPRQGEPA